MIYLLLWKLDTCCVPVLRYAHWKNWLVKPLYFLNYKETKKKPLICACLLFKEVLSNEAVVKDRYPEITDFCLNQNHYQFKLFSGEVAFLRCN